MATVRDITEIGEYFRSLSSGFSRAGTKAQVNLITRAHRLGLENQKRQFTGRHGRRLSGQLFNAQYYGFESTESGIPTAYLGIRNVPYGRIHEYGSEGLPGGVIKPVKAQKLWIPNYEKVDKMRPREFIKLMRANPGHYHIFENSAVRWTGNYIAERGIKKKRWETLFYLQDEVKIPARPYLTPAIQAVIGDFPGLFMKYWSQEVD